MARFFKCDICNKIVAVLKEGSPTTVCCGQDMRELIPGTVDASKEKHVPFISVNGTEVTVQVGVEKHPTEEKHHIEWVCLETDRGIQLKYLVPGKDPVAKFFLEAGEKPYAAYAFCNLHGLWSANI